MVIFALNVPIPRFILFTLTESGGVAVPPGVSTPFCSPPARFLLTSSHGAFEPTFHTRFCPPSLKMVNV